MIKINLLPVRAAKRKETVRQQAVILAGTLVLVLLIALGAYSYFLIRINSTKDEISKAEQELTELKAKIGKINELEKLKAEVTKKLNVLNQLRREKTGPVNRLQTISQAVPERLWLTNYVESGTTVTLTGVAFTEELIADFMRSIEQSPDFMNVELVVSEQVMISGMKLKKFDLRFGLEPPKG
ncbi:MAG: fimbrial protein [Geobacter sp.]|nr:MAG: fimbrial protein [Geobacter sp.]